MLWQIRSFPRCAFHVFLSHSAEDRPSLVQPVLEAIEARGVIPWIDQKDYSHGRPSRVALQDGILLSRHTVFFITDAMLNSPRGWCVMELTLAEIVQANLQVRGGQLANSVLPLFFVDRTDERLPRSVWQDLRDLGQFYPVSTKIDPIEWAASEIVNFLKREQQLSKQWATATRRDKDLKELLKTVQGLSERAIRFDPDLIP